MRLLITGGAGFIGSYVAERATAAGHEVRILDNLDPQVHPDPSQVSLPPKAEFVRGDVRDRETCQCSAGLKESWSIFLCTRLRGDGAECGPATDR